MSEKRGSGRNWRAAMGREREGETADCTAETTPPTAMRSSLKSLPQFNWKQKLRDNCYKRVREDRRRLLWRVRMGPQPPQLVDASVRSAFEDIVSDEFQKMKHNSDSDSHTVDDLLWDYDGVCSSFQGECEDILLEMQRIFYEDLNPHPPILGLETAIDTWEDEVDEFLASAVYEHMQLNENDKAHREEIWCPICKQGELKEDHSRIYCNRCELQLDKANELTLGILRDRLAEAHTEHLDRGCRLKPRFCLNTKFSLTALYISCEGCETFEVVI